MVTEVSSSQSGSFRRRASDAAISAPEDAPPATVEKVLDVSWVTGKALLAMKTEVEVQDGSPVNVLGIKVVRGKRDVGNAAVVRPEVEVRGWDALFDKIITCDAAGLAESLLDDVLAFTMARVLQDFDDLLEVFPLHLV